MASHLTLGSWYLFISTCSLIRFDILVFLSVGLFLLPYTITNQTDDYVYADRKHPDEHIEPIEYGVVSGGRPKWGVRRIWELLLAFCFFCFSLFIVVMAPFPMKIFKSPVPGYVFFALNFGLITIAIAYYYGIMYVWRDGRNFCGVKMSWEETFDDYSGQRLNLVFTPDAVRHLESFDYISGQLHLRIKFF